MAGGRLLIRLGSLNALNPGTTISHNTRAGGQGITRLHALALTSIFSRFVLYVLMNYLTNVWNLSITHAGAVTIIFYGSMYALQIVAAIFVDAFLGDFYMLVLSNIASSIGLGLLSLSTPTFFGPCTQYKEECIGHVQKVLFYTALTLIVVGMVGEEVSMISFFDQQELASDSEESPNPIDAQAPPEPESMAELGIEQNTEAEDPVEAQDPAAAKVMMILLVICGGIALPYVKSWSIRFGIPAICFLTATVLFFTGCSQYKRSKPQKSPLITALRVFVAAATKDFQQVKSFKQIYNDDDALSTNNLRWLDKAAIKFPDQALSKSWTLCTVREVEDTKTGVRMVPILLTLIGTGVVISLDTSYFVGQANHMDRKLGSIQIQIPIFFLFYGIFCLTSPSIFNAVIKCTSIPKRYYAPTKIAVGMVLSVLCCITAAIVEIRRLRVIRNHGLLNSNERIPMSVFYLLPQFLLHAAVDGFIDSGIERLIEQSTPETMHKHLVYFVKFFTGLGHMANVLLVYVMGKVSERNNNHSWFQHTLNESRLDRYYWTLAGLSAVNLVVYAVVASFYNYKEIQSEEDGA